MSRAPPDIGNMTSLKVDNISYRTSPEDLRRLFEKYGEIGDIHIPRDKYTRESKGFAFVRFYDRRDAEYALERLDGRSLDGRPMRVMTARYERPIDEQRGGYRSGGGRDYQGGRDRDRRRRSGSRSRSRSRSRSPRRRRDSRSPPRKTSRSPTRSPHSRPGSKSASRSPAPGRDKSPSRSRSRSPSNER